MNNEEKHAVHTVIFNLIDAMVMGEEPFILSYFTHIGYFTPAQYKLFSKRILDKRNKEIQTNQLHFIIFYAVIHITAEIYKSKTMTKALQGNIEPENITAFEESNKMYVIFCNNVLDELRKDYKNNYSMIGAMVKIDAFGIVE